jgi:hypothetical protein
MCFRSARQGAQAMDDKFPRQPHSSNDKNAYEQADRPILKCIAKEGGLKHIHRLKPRAVKRFLKRHSLAELWGWDDYLPRDSLDRVSGLSLSGMIDVVVIRITMPGGIGMVFRKKGFYTCYALRKTTKERREKCQDTRQR